jgi:hypothetical protein
VASVKAVAASLKLLARAFAGVVDDARVEVYNAALEDLTDAQLAAATTIVIKTHTGEFIPPPAVLLKAVAPVAVAVDASAIVRRIEKLATYSAHAGMIYPGVDQVRAELGETVAYAYAAAGGPRIFSENDTTRSIAEREFSKAITEAANRPQSALPIIGGEPPRPRLVSGDA